MDREMEVRSTVGISTTSPVTARAKGWVLPATFVTTTDQTPLRLPASAGIRTRSTLLRRSESPPTTETPFEKTLPRYSIPSGAMSLRSRSLINRGVDWAAPELPGASVQVNVDRDHVSHWLGIGRSSSLQR